MQRVVGPFEFAEVCAERDRHGAELATVRAERDRLLAAAVAQADAQTECVERGTLTAFVRREEARVATEALGRELRGAR